MNGASQRKNPSMGMFVNKKSTCKFIQPERKTVRGVDVKCYSVLITSIKPGLEFKKKAHQAAGFFLYQ